MKCGAGSSMTQATQVIWPSDDRAERAPAEAAHKRAAEEQRHARRSSRTRKRA